MNKYDYVTGYLPEDNSLGSRIEKTGKKSRRRISHTIKKGLFYTVTIASVATVVIIVSSYMGMGESISASSKPALEKQETKEKPIWLSISMSNSDTKENNAQNMFQEDLEQLFKNHSK